MLQTKFIRDRLKEKQTATGSSLGEEALVVALHMEHHFGLAHADATDQTSQSGSDHGIDAWFYDKKNNKLYILQSKLTENASQIRRGLDDLLRGADWLSGCLKTGLIDEKPTNHALFNLHKATAEFASKIKTVVFVLLSPYESIDEMSENLGSVYIEEFKKSLSRHDINESYETAFEIQPYELKSNKIPRPPKKYPVRQFEGSELKYKQGDLNIVYLPLEQLVELYRMRGPELFHKNIRLTVWDGKKNSAKKVAHPMKDTLRLIVDGKEAPEVFAFYHSGVTIFADKAEFSKGEVLLENPSIINGCQTTTIATSFLDDINTKKNKLFKEQVKKFGKINVVAKIITGVTTDDLREITNNNNRQNEIEGWQLYSNDPIHIRIEANLKELRVFYGRQAGLYNERMKSAEQAQFYENCNTELTPKMLGQVQAVYLGKYNYAAKPDTIFESKDHHDEIFSEKILLETAHMTFRANSHKCIRNAIKSFIKSLSDGPVRDSYEVMIGGGRNQRFYYAIEHAAMKIAEKKMPEDLKLKSTSYLYKTAPSTITDYYREICSPLLKIAKGWYKETSEGRQGELTKGLLDQFVKMTLDKYL